MKQHFISREIQDNTTGFTADKHIHLGTCNGKRCTLAEQSCTRNSTSARKIKIIEGRYSVLATTLVFDF